MATQAEEDIRRCFALGATRVSIDFSCPSTNLLEKFIELNNRVIDRFSVAERAKIGIYAAAGGVDYAQLAPSMFDMNAGDS